MIVGELLAQLNLAAINGSAGSVSHEVSTVYFGYDLRAPFSKQSCAADLGFRHRFIRENGDIIESWYYDQGFANACGVTVRICRTDVGFKINVEIPFGSMELTLHSRSGFIDFAGLSQLSNMAGEFSGCVRASGKQSLSEYVLEYSDMEVNTFSETLTVDDRSGRIVSVDSAENDHDDKAET